MADKTASTFVLRYEVRVSIQAAPGGIWSRLTDARRFPEWNSTVESIEGEIAAGQRLSIRVPAAPGRVFTPRVIELVAGQRMVWQDGFFPMFQGTRTFTLTPGPAAVEFSMVEEFRGLMVPMIRGSLPDFGPIFDRYAADLKKACEAPS